MVSKVPYYVLYWYLTSDQKEICFYFQNLDNNAKLKEENEKKKRFIFKYLKKYLQQILITGLI